MGCHFRLASSEGAQIGLPELDLGAVPVWGGSARLAKCVGEHHAMDMILRSKKISGKTALEIGLVHEVWPLNELKEAALRLANELAAQPAHAVASMMRVLVNSSERSLKDLIREERKAVKDNSGTKDSLEGMNAFLEKKKNLFLIKIRLNCIEYFIYIESSFRVLEKVESIWHICFFYIFWNRSFH